jgi:hypothetical protein
MFELRVCILYANVLVEIVKASLANSISASPSIDSFLSRFRWGIPIYNKDSGVLLGVSSYGGGCDQACHPSACYDHIVIALNDQVTLHQTLSD